MQIIKNKQLKLLTILILINSSVDIFAYNNIASVEDRSVAIDSDVTTISKSRSTATIARLDESYKTLPQTKIGQANSFETDEITGNRQIRQKTMDRASTDNLNQQLSNNDTKYTNNERYNKSEYIQNSVPGGSNQRYDDEPLVNEQGGGR